MRNAAWLVLTITACSQIAPVEHPRVTTQAAGAYYVNCAATIAGNGSASSPWNSLSSVNATTFAAGDSVFFNRGTTCTGMFWPKGSGATGALITAGAYGSGAKPIIAGGTNTAAIKLYNQHHWRIENLETSGGNPYGVYVAGNVVGVLDTVQLVNLTVHDVGGTATKKESGLVVVTPESKDTAFSNVLIDGVNAYNTQQWSGIIVGGDNFENLGYSGSVASTGVTIRNSAVSNTYGDGIVVFHAKNALIETSVAHDVGKIPTGAIGTPNGIWTWWCDTCTVQSNEAYNVASPGVDGGAFDIDYWNVNNTVQYNYGHDNQGYCVAVFGAGGRATTGSIVRYNICANNGRLAGNSVQTGSKQGDFYTATWNGGSIDGVQVYNNTFYWNPGSNEPALVNRGATLSGNGTRAFMNNIVVSTVDKLVWSDNNLSLNNNLYFYTNGSSPWWGYNGGWWNSLSAYQSSSGQDGAGRYGDPLLNSSGYHGIGRPTTQYTLQAGSPAVNAGTDVGGTGGRDFYGNSAPRSGAYDIGANESGFGATGANLVQNPSFESGAANWANWWDTGVNASSAAYFSTQGGHTGSGRLAHWSASAPYKQYTSQDITGVGLTPGTYTLKVWTQTSGGLTKISFGGKNCNGAGTQELSLSTAGSPTWTQSSMQVTVSGSGCQVFVWSESGGGAERWLNVDDIEFTKN
jgi:hypothetical protein